MIPTSLAEMLAVTGKFKMTFVKIDGSFRSGIWSIADEQRETKNPDLITLVEYNKDGTTHYRSIDVFRYGITEFELIKQRRPTNDHLIALRKMIKAAGGSYKKAYTYATKTKGFRVKLYDIDMQSFTILDIQRYAYIHDASYRAYSSKGDIYSHDHCRTIEIYFK